MKFSVRFCTDQKRMSSTCQICVYFRKFLHICKWEEKMFFDGKFSKFSNPQQGFGRSMKFSHKEEASDVRNVLPKLRQITKVSDSFRFYFF